MAGLEPVHSAALLAQKKKKRKLMSKKTTGSELVTSEAQGEENTQKEKIKKSTSLAIEDDLKRSALMFSFKIIVKLQHALLLYFLSTSVHRQSLLGGLKMRVSELLKVFLPDLPVCIGASQLFPR